MTNDTNPYELKELVDGQTTIEVDGLHPIDLYKNDGLTDAQREAANGRIAFMTQGEDLNKWDGHGFGTALAKLRTYEATPWAMAQLIYRGAAIKPVMRPVYRTDKHGVDRWHFDADTFHGAFHIMLDFDTEDACSTIERFKNDDFMNWFASFAYTSPSHRDDAPRARVVFIIPEGIFDADKFEKLAKALLKRYPEADQSCGNADRLYYGSVGFNGWANWSLLPLDVVDALVAEIEADEAREADARRRALANQRVVVTGRSGNYANYTKKAIDAELQSIRMAKVNKHDTLKDAATKLASLAAAPWSSVTLDDARALVIDAATPWVRNEHDARELERKVDDFFAIGSKTPRKEPVSQVVMPTTFYQAPATLAMGVA